MTETFLILLAGGVLLAAAVSDPRQVTLLWLRLCGIIALALCALGIFFFTRRGAPASFAGHQTQWLLLGATAVAILLQLAFVQVARRRSQRFFAAATFACANFAAAALLRPLMPAPYFHQVVILAACAGISAMTGLVLMDMLLGHAYLTASRMTMAPFRRLNLWLAGVLILRSACAVGLVILLQSRTPVPMLVGKYGLLIGTRYLVGLLIPAVFTYMAHDCIGRRATQSATGILYVNGLLIFIGELIALYLVGDTGLPF